ncbi:berberine bridge enzyme-like 4 [Beta vulgaris subsp. vulgaris]|uniref:berberine bridge enzyme-like 4 n=1 Tax=Beta vulgaris subsp. vulgaris TaxID=3555 RepID=UPI00203700A7|nr:berberine bridge enzyme-like 4 [Beta vulgaris subsp. vulgaris]
MSLSTSLITSMLKTLFLICIILQVDASSSEFGTIDSFIDCLPRHPNNASNSITKAIYTPQNASFLSILHAHVRNLRFNTSSTKKPLAIVTPLEVSHVQATIICAKTHGLEMRIRSGGHDFEGLSYVSSNPFILLDLFNLRSINIDLASDTAWVQSGATLGELYYNIANVSNTHAFPAGVCPSVGIGGHFTGGGYGNMLRKFGLTIDNIVDAQVVDVNGMILNRKTMGEDLFWAIRGGGAASFCVVLAWKIRLVHIPEIVTTFVLNKTLEEGGNDTFYQWQYIAPNLTPNLFIRTEVSVQPLDGETSNKTVHFMFIALYLGRSNALVQLLNKNFPSLGLKKEVCIEQRWVESTIFFYGLPMNSSLEVLLDRAPPLGLTYDKHKSDYVKKPIPKMGLEKLWKKMLEVENVVMQFNPYGGKMSQISETKTPFPHRRGNLFKIQYLSYWKENSVEITRRNIQGVKEIYSLMTSYVSKNPREAFLNYRDIDIGTNANNSSAFALDFFKGNLEKLLKVKAKVDPSNFFRYEQSIPVLSSK